MSKQPVGSDSTFRDGFIEGAARAFFVMAYADYCENEDPDHKLPYASNGGHWEHVAPATPPNAYALAGEMWAALEHANPGACGVFTLHELARAADGCDVDPEDFGHDIAMQYMGSGVSWFDDHKKFPINIPYAEITMFTFDAECYQPEE